MTRSSPCRYQATLDELKAKGRCQIERYAATTPDIGAVIEQQLSNVQESYNSLLYTAQQIRGRLCDSLAKFQQYEDTLESIMGSLDECEPLVTSSVEDNLSLAVAQGQLEQARVSIVYSSAVNLSGMFYILFFSLFMLLLVFVVEWTQTICKD